MTYPLRRHGRADFPEDGVRGSAAPRTQAWPAGRASREEQCYLPVTQDPFAAANINHGPEVCGVVYEEGGGGKGAASYIVFPWWRCLPMVALL